MGGGSVISEIQHTSHKITATCHPLSSKFTKNRNSNILTRLNQSIEHLITPTQEGRWMRVIMFYCEIFQEDIH